MYTHLNDYSSNYSELFQSSGLVSIETQRLRALAQEDFKTLNDLNNVTHRRGNLFCLLLKQ